MFLTPIPAIAFCFCVSVSSDDSSDSDFEDSESSEQSGVSEELSESENDGKRRKTRWEEMDTIYH